MKISRVTSNEFSLYDQYTLSHHDGSFLQSRIWGEFQKKYNSNVFLYLFKTDEGKIVGSAQIFLKKIAGINKEYIYCPYGPLTNEGIDNIDSFIEQLKKDFPEILFIRIEAKTNYNLNGVKTIRIQPKETVINDLKKPTAEILANMHQKARYNIKLANKHGVEVSVVKNNPEEIHQSIQLFEETSLRQNFKNFPLEYYLTMIKELGFETDMIKLYKASYQEQTLAAAIMLDYGNTRTYLYGGSTNQHRNVMAPYALHWQAMQDAKENSLERYDWWGLRTSEGKISGFTEFKLRFGGTEYIYPNAIDIVNNQAWYTIYNVLRKINRFVLHLPFLRTK